MSTFQIPVPSVSTPLTTLTPNSLTHEQKNINLSPSTTTPLYSINISSTEQIGIFGKMNLNLWMILKYLKQLNKYLGI